MRLLDCEQAEPWHLISGASQLELSHLLSQIPDRPKQQATDAKLSIGYIPIIKSQAC